MINNNKYNKGHRQRIFHEIIKKGIHHFTTIEIIEICLFLSIPRKNVKPIAHALYEKYQYIYIILGLSREELLTIDGLGYQSYVIFQILLKLIQYTQEEKIYEKEVFCILDDVIAYCRWKMSFLTYEQLRVLYFNTKNKLIKDEVQGIGTINQVNIYPREIIKRCLDLGATGVILCHNHPSGDSTPSPEDKTATYELKKITDLLNIKLHDHIIIGDNKFFSMRKAGLL